MWQENATQWQGYFARFEEKSLLRPHQARKNMKMHRM
jgi:hypothetical protein